MIMTTKESKGEMVMIYAKLKNAEEQKLLDDEP